MEQLADKNANQWPVRKKLTRKGPVREFAKEFRRVILAQGCVTKARQSVWY
jgi:hypothetical protein